MSSILPARTESSQARSQPNRGQSHPLPDAVTLASNGSIHVSFKIDSHVMVTRR